MAWLQTPRGPSGHSYWRKARFAGALFSLFQILAVVGAAKDIYLEKFGADATTMGVLWALLTMWSPMNEVIQGSLQDRQVLARFFPRETWGRRAPWLFTHCILAAVAASLIYLPPGSTGSQAGHMDQASIHAWFMAMVLLAYWGSSSCMIAFECTRQEIYPFKEERIIVEGLCKYACMLGAGAGGIPVLVLMADASQKYRLAFLFYILPLSLISLEAVPIFREARAHVAALPLGGVLKIFREALPCAVGANASALRHLMAVKLWNGAYGASIASMLFYYVTYVLRLSSWERMLVIGGSGLTAGCTEAIMNLAFMRLFGSGDGRRDTAGVADRQLLHIVVILRVANALVTVLVIGVASPTVPLLFLWCITTRMGLCGFTFWRVSAQCWLVDEDCALNVKAERREGTIFGALSMTQNCAGAVLSSVTFLGLGLAGLHTENCEAKCEDVSSVGGEDILRNCAELCLRGVIDTQPESLRLYIRLVIGLWAPLCELLAVFHAYQFPIKGARLRRLYNLVAKNRGDIVEPQELALAQPLDSLQVAKHSAASKIVLQVDGSPGAFGQQLWLERLASTTALAERWPRPMSLAVFFDVLDSDGELASSSTRSSIQRSEQVLSSEVSGSVDCSSAEEMEANSARISL